MSEFIQYLIQKNQENSDRLPSLSEMSKELGVSISSLREQMEVARVLGFIEVKPRTGIRRAPYSFKPAVMQSLKYAASLGSSYFQHFADLRKHIEAAYWYEATLLLTVSDLNEMTALIQRAKEKLNGSPIQIPSQEHRDLHMVIYQRLNNPFVLGLLDAYWELYKAEGMDVYPDIHYLDRVWQYHERIVEALRDKQFTAGYQLLMEHMELIYQRSKPDINQKFE